MFETISLFDAMEQDDTQHRIASRKALALAHNRIESSVGKFLRAAQNETEFMDRLALVQDDFAAYVTAAADEAGYDHPEHIAASLQDHYRLASYKPQRKWTPRVAVDFTKGPLGPNPYDQPGDNFYDAQGQPAGDPMRNPQGYMRPSVPSPIPSAGHDEGYEQIPYGVDPNATMQRDYADDQGLQIQPNLPPVNVPPGAPIHQGAQQGQGQPPYGAGLPGSQVDFNHPGYNPDTYHICQNCMNDFIDPDGRTPCPHCGSPGGEKLAASPQDTTLQNDGASNLVTCPQCGGSGNGPNGNTCSKCKGKGKVPNFGDSMVDALGERDASRRISEEGKNTDLGGPEPKMDKRQWTPSNPGMPEQLGDVERKDILEPIPARNDHELNEIGENHTKREDLPAATGDNAGFAAPKVGPAPHTKTFGDGKHAEPVTREPLN